MGDDGVARQAMAEPVELGALFAGVGARASGFLGVGSISGSAVVTVGTGGVVENVRHLEDLLFPSLRGQRRTGAG